jgi:hypothetical protein
MLGPDSTAYSAKLCVDNHSLAFLILIQMSRYSVYIFLLEAYVPSLSMQTGFTVSVVTLQVVVVAVFCIR